MMEFPETLQRLRAQRGLTQEQLAQQLYVSRTAVSKWESGRGMPSVDSLQLLARFFDVTVDDLLSGTAAEPPAENAELPETTKENAAKRRLSARCGALDLLLAALMIFAPIFGQHMPDGRIHGVSLLVYPEFPLWLKSTVLIWTGVVVFGGAAQLLFRRTGDLLWIRRGIWFGIIWELLGVYLLVLTRRPYPSMAILAVLSAKVLLVRKR